MNLQSHMSDTPSDNRFFYSLFSLNALLSDGNFSSDHMNKKKGVYWKCLGCGHEDIARLGR